MGVTRSEELLLDRGQRFLADEKSEQRPATELDGDQGEQTIAGRTRVAFIG